MDRVLLFGATGFLGRAAGAALRDDPRVLEVVTVGRRPVPGTRWIRHDLVSDPTSALTRLLAETTPDAVVNCAGRLSGSYSDLVAANTGAVASLVDAVLASTPKARLVTLGSAAEYGVVKPGERIRETDPAIPVSGYGVTRLAATQLVELAARGGDLDAVVLRVFNPVGPGLPEHNLAGRAVRELHRALDTGAGEIRMGPLGAYRDFVDVRDVASAVVAAVFAPRVPGMVCNVGSGTAVTCRTLVHLLAETAGFAGTITECHPPSARSPGVDWIAADLGHTARVLGWSPRHGLAESAESTWAGGATDPGRQPPTSTGRHRSTPATSATEPTASTTVKRP
jgi:nucleoside-diphosphate-sugar epimerase